MNQQREAQGQCSFGYPGHCDCVQEQCPPDFGDEWSHQTYGKSAEIHTFAPMLGAGKHI